MQFVFESLKVQGLVIRAEKISTIVNFLPCFRAISVEVQHSNKTAIRNLLFENGYKVLTTIEEVDIVFVKDNKK